MKEEKTMKKLFALVLALCLLCSATALAGTYSNPTENAQTTLTTTLNESFTVLIPSTLSIPFNRTSTNLPIQVTALRLLPVGTVENTVRALQVKVNQPNLKLVNESDSTSKIDYDIGGGEGTPARTHYFTAVGSKNFNVTISQSEWNNAAAGTYKETITFTVGITNK